MDRVGFDIGIKSIKIPNECYFNHPGKCFIFNRVGKINKKKVLVFLAYPVDHYPS